MMSSSKYFEYSKQQRNSITVQSLIFQNVLNGCLPLNRIFLSSWKEADFFEAFFHTSLDLSTFSLVETVLDQEIFPNRPPHLKLNQVD